MPSLSFLCTVLSGAKKGDAGTISDVTRPNLLLDVQFHASFMLSIVEIEINHLFLFQLDLS